MAGAVYIIPATARLRCNSNIADNKDECDSDLSRGKHLAHVSQEQSATIKKDFALTSQSADLGGFTP